MKKISVRGWPIQPLGILYYRDGAVIAGRSAIYLMEHGYGARLAQEQARLAARQALDYLEGRRRTSYADGSREPVNV